MSRSGLALFTALACAARARAGSVVYESELCSSEAANWDTSELSSQISFATGAGDGCVLRMEWLTENRNYAWLYPSAGLPASSNAGARFRQAESSSASDSVVKHAQNVHAFKTP